MTKAFCTVEDFNYEDIRRSYSGTSFVPEKRAEDEIKSRVEWLNAEAARFAEMCSNEGQRAYLAVQLPIFKEQYLGHVRRLVSTRSNCISTMIAGPARFPVRRAEKANAAERRAVDAILEWAKRAKASIAKGIEARKTSAQIEQEYMDEMRRMIRRSYLAEDWGRKNCYGRLQTWAKYASPEMVCAALDFLKKWQDEHHGGKGFTPRHKIWRLADMTPEEVESTTAEINGITVVKNAVIDRVQIVFPGKPEPDVIAQLKAHGWRWSQKNCAWQRQNTDNAYRSAVEIAEM